MNCFKCGSNHTTPRNNGYMCTHCGVSVNGSTKFFSPDEKTKRFTESGHLWAIYADDAYGHADVFAYEDGICNGPVCIRCGYGACWHCQPNPPRCGD